MTSTSISLQDLKSLSFTQKSALKQGNYKLASDLILAPTAEISKKLRISFNEAQVIIDSVSKELSPKLIRIEKLTQLDDGYEKFTTGDALLDEIIGGGIRTSMIWEFVGESASGKTQLALQLSLLVQVRPILGGLSGSACYLTTRARLPTERLAQLIVEHDLLSPSICGLSDIHTQSIPTIDVLLHTLAITLPALQRDLANSSKKPLRLIVIDSLSSLLQSTEKSSAVSIFERSKYLYELSRIIHTIASRDKIAFVIINEATDVFKDNHSLSHNRDGESAKVDVLYRDQAPLFGSAHSIHGEDTKEATMGLVWANQVNARIMLTRSDRWRFLGAAAPAPKRRRIEGGHGVPSQQSDWLYESDDDFADQSTLIRRLSVVFNSASAPSSVDFVITKQGVSVIADEVASGPPIAATKPKAQVPPDRAPKTVPVANADIQTARSALLNPTDEPAVEPSASFDNCDIQELDPLERPPDAGLEVIPSSCPEDNGDVYWDDFDDPSYEAFAGVDFDVLDKENVDAAISASQAADSV